MTHCFVDAHRAPTTDPTPGVIRRRESSARSYSRWFPHTIVAARGSEIVDDRGRSYIDFLAGAGSLNYGHNDPDMKAALIDYLSGDGIVHSLDLVSEAKAAFLETFVSTVLQPRGLDHHVQFTGPTGANAVEAAVKLARKATGRNTVIAFTRAFHGCSAGALAATAASHFRGGPQQALHGVVRMPYDGYLGDQVDTAQLLESMLADPSGGIDPPAAILLETVQGEGGLSTASPAWMQRVADIARRHGALLIVDDIQAGCGRTGTFFSFEPLGVTPDIVTLSKSLSGYGLPLSVVLIHPDIDIWKPAEHNGTFRGNVPAFVTARVALEKFWSTDAFAADIARRSDIVRAGLTRTAALVPGSVVRGRGMMLGLDVSDPSLAGDVRAHCAANGLLLETCGPADEVVKVLAPLTTDDHMLRRGLDIVHGAVEAHARPFPLAG